MSTRDLCLLSLQLRLYANNTDCRFPDVCICLMIHEFHCVRVAYQHREHVAKGKQLYEENTAHVRVCVLVCVCVCVCVSLGWGGVYL